MTEKTLVQAAQAGLPEAADELIERYYPRVYSYVAAQKGGDAEDLTQEVFARALHALPRFNGEYQFGAWLLQIARNVCIDEARRQVHRPQPTDPVDLVELEPTGVRADDVWESVASQIAVGTVHRALAKLPARQRTVLVLRELEGMSYADIAIALRVSTRAVEISLSRARKRMRLELNRLELVEGEKAACRRAAALLATDPSAVSREEVAAHVRQCTICQSATGRRRSRDFMHGAWAIVLGAPAGAGEGIRRLAMWGQRLGQSAAASSSTATMAPLSRMAEVGASVAMATAVSAGTFAPAAAPPPPVIPVVAPVVAPADPVPLAVLPPAPPAQVAPVASPPVPATVSAPVTHTSAAPLTCALDALGHPASGSTSSGSTSGGSTPAGAPLTAATGQLLNELLTPINALTPALACVGQGLSGLLPGAPAGAGSPTTTGSAASSSPSGAPDLLKQLLGGQLASGNPGNH